MPPDPCIVVDPDSFNPNPDKNTDPAFQENPDPVRIRIQGFVDQKKQGKIFWYIFLLKIAICLI